MLVPVLRIACVYVYDGRGWGEREVESKQNSENTIGIFRGEIRLSVVNVEVVRSSRILDTF